MHLLLRIHPRLRFGVAAAWAEVLRLLLYYWAIITTSLSNLNIDFHKENHYAQPIRMESLP